MSWTYTISSPLDQPDPGWGTVPASCDDLVLGGQLYSGVGVDLDVLAGSGTTATASGWTISVEGDCLGTSTPSDASSGGFVEFDCLGGTGVTVSASGWIMRQLESCHDG